MSHVIVAAAALAVWLGVGGSAAEPARKAYLAHVSAVCQSYARRLERVPAPSDPAAYGDVISSLERVQPPSTLQPTVGRLFAIDRGSIAPLEAALAAARRRDAGGVAKGLVRFSSVRDRVHSLAVAVGIRCGAN
jgi:hypothetical protein